MMFWENIKQNILILIGILILVIIYYIINIGNRYVDEEKKIKINNKKLVTIFICILILYILYMLIKKYPFLSEIINITILSLIFAYLFNPIVEFIEEKGISRLWSVIIVYIFIIAILAIIFFTFLPKIIREFKNLGNVLPIYLEKVDNFLYNINNSSFLKSDNLPPQLDGIKDVFKENLESIESFVVKWFSNFADKTINMFSKIFIIAIIPIISFYFLKDKEFFKKKIYLTIPKSHRNEMINLFKEIDTMLGQFIRGRVIVGIFVGVSTTIALALLKINFAFIIGMLAGLADIIPYFGPVIGIIPAVFFAILESPIKALWVIIIFTIIQQVENDIITPKVVGESVGIHPVTVMLSLIIGGRFFGILGMVLAIPVVAILKIIYSHFVESRSKT
ncbi:AI-2E family transporter [Sporanaerobacter acetigenes]|uniref:Predicted PurR-regulated permease PerM n=2 Tax=Sporanaerobacter acetigenes TaxID=165813 RepID=A0A1M5UDF5_9FIRM|nr:Predicted PurR-regulated permease PerM [Sporanaerobacter acetigenes DSM 13106]